MPRVKLNETLQKEMCERLVQVLRIAYDDNWTQLAQRLGYSNKSGVQGLKAGTHFPDPQRLVLLMEHPTQDGYIPSIAWVIAGKGPALIRFQEDRIDGMELRDLAIQRAAQGKFR